VTGVRLVSQKEVESLLQRFDFRRLAGKRLLITGVTGMVGSYLCEAILRSCEEAGGVQPELTLLARQASRSNLATISHRKNVTVVETALSTWHSDLEFDYCVHAASPASPTQYSDAVAVSEANLGFLKSLSKGKLPGVLLFVSSGEIYGPQAPLGVSEDFEGESAPRSLRSIYPEAKKAAELLLRQLGEEGRTKPVVARLFHSFGPGVNRNDGRSFADFLWSGALGQDIILRSSGSDIRTFMYLEDSIAGILNCLTLGSGQEIYNVGSDVPERVADFAEAVGRICGVEVIKQPIGNLEKDSYLHSPNKSLVPSNSKLRSLGWSEQVTLEEGIQRSICWIRMKLEEHGDKLN
jgi:UDP-glucuronate decarboxylase